MKLQRVFYFEKSYIQKKSKYQNLGYQVMMFIFCSIRPMETVLSRFILIKKSQMIQMLQMFQMIQMLQILQLPHWAQKAAVIEKQLAMIKSEIHFLCTMQRSAVLNLLFCLCCKVTNTLSQDYRAVLSRCFLGEGSLEPNFEEILNQSKDFHV